MNRLIQFGAFIILLTSCYTQKRTYIKPLSIEQSNELKLNRVVIVDHKSYHKPMRLTKTGKLKIIKSDKKYEFVHLGRWTECEDDGFESVIENYDDNGTPINFTNYDFKRNLDVYIEYKIDSLDKQPILLEHLTRYYPNGKIKEEYTEYKINKKIYKHGTYIKLDSTGHEISRKVYERGLEIK